MQILAPKGEKKADADKRKKNVDEDIAILALNPGKKNYDLGLRSI